ncbi:MAG: gliding motility-associated C-terminal domain-containing protein [Bacteroidetes bacterium]|nr:gliding motility-associated C-terminal domain-containing protein [Bacteroidota bacterium]MCB9042574.1 gliding motility-associated C-terminal domain-containing protein [Chitinophagales bacterium]
MQQKKLLFIIFCLITTIFSTNAHAQTLVVNEVTNYPNSSNVDVELLVSCPAGCKGVLDIRNWIVDDNSGMGSTCGQSNTGLAPGHLRFPDVEEYACVPCGAFIVLTNGASQDPYDSNNDFLYHIGYAGMNANPTVPNNSACNDFGTAAQATSSGSEGIINLRNAGDLVQVRDNNGNLINGISWGDISASSGVPSVYNGSAANHTFYATTCSGTGFMDGTPVSDPPDVNSANTPGLPNPGQEGCIDLMRIDVSHSDSTLAMPACDETSFSFMHDACGNFETDWDFGDGSAPETITGSIADVSHTFTSEGTFYVLATIRFQPNDCPVEVLDTVMIDFPDKPEPPTIPTPTLCYDNGSLFGVLTYPQLSNFLHEMQWFYTSTDASPFSTDEEPDLDASILSQINAGGAFPQYVSFWVAENDGTCDSERVEFVITVNGVLEYTGDNPNYLCQADYTNLNLTALVSPQDATVVEFCGSNATVDANISLSGNTYVLNVDNLADGTYTISYGLSGSNCNDCGGTFDVVIIGTPVIDNPGTVCLSDGNVTFTATPPGGTWEGTGVVGGASNTTGIFNPNNWPLNASNQHEGTINYTFPNGSGCFATITVIAETAPSVSNPPAVCNTASSGAVNLNSFLTPSGSAGTWAFVSGPQNISPGTGNSVSFDGVTAGNYVFSFTSSGACGGSPLNLTQVVNDCACPTTSNPSAICSDEILNLADYINTTASGTWSISNGTGGSISGTTFNPNGNSGNFTATFTLTTAIPGCSNTYDIPITVNALADAGTGANTSVCNDSNTAIDLFAQLSGETTSGTWTVAPATAGFNAAGGSFNPNGVAANNYVFTYTVTGACVNGSGTATVSINVSQSVNVTASPNTATVCNAGAGAGINLNNNLSTSVAGTWADTDASGALQSGSLFDFSGVNAGNYTFTFTPSVNAPCTATPVTVEVTVNDCSCPLIQSTNASAIQVCENGGNVTITITVNTSTNLENLTLTENGNNINLTQSGTTFTATISPPSISNCNVLTQNYVANLYCTTNPAVVEDTETLSISFYPQPTGNISLDATGCVATLNPDCANFSVSGGGTTQTTNVNGDNSAVSFSLQNNDFPSCTNTITSNFACVTEFECPTVQPASNGLDICSNTVPDLSNANTGFSILTDPDNTAGNLLWFTSVGPVTPYNNTPFINTNCDVQLVTLYAYLECDKDGNGIFDNLNGDEYVSAGSVNITVFPQYNSNLVSATPGDCALPTLTTSCANYIITPINVPTEVIPGITPGLAIFGITYVNDNLTCLNTTEEVAYNCPSVDCPTIINAINATENYCLMGSPNFANIELAADWDDPNGQVPAGDAIVWFSNAAFSGVPLDETNYQPIYIGDNCSPQTITLYAALLCNSGSPVPAGTLTITLYPEFDAANISTTEGNCAPPSIQSNCDNYAITALTAVPAVVNPGDAGSVTWQITYSGTTDCDFSNIEYEVNYSCAELSCPTITNLSISPDADNCSGENVIATLTYDDPQNTFTNINWFDAQGNIVGTGTSLSITETVNGCDALELTYTASIYCSTNPPNLPSDSETFTITYYPLPSSNEISFTPSADGCSIEATSSCPNFSITTTNPQVTGTDGTWTANFTVQNTEAVSNGANCVVDFMENGTCTLPQCPLLSSISPDGHICSGDSYNLAAVLINTQDLDHVEWLDESGAVVSNANTYQVNTTTSGCNSQTETYTFNAYCITDLVNPTISETVSVTIYPVPTASDVQITLSNNNCTATATITNCSNIFAVSATSTNPISTNIDGDMSAVNFEIFNTEAQANGINCSIVVSDNFDCSIPVNCTEDASLLPFASNVCSSIGTIDLTAQIAGDMGGLWYNVTNGNQQILLPSLYDVSTLAAGNYNLQYVVEGSNGCPNVSDNITLTITNIPIILNPSQTLCTEGAGAQLNLNTLLGAGTPTNGTWETINPAYSTYLNGNVLDVNGATGISSISLTYTLPDNCNSSVTIGVNELPTISLIPFAGNLCTSLGNINLNVQLGAGTPTNGTWIIDPGNVTISNPSSFDLASLTSLDNQSLNYTLTYSIVINNQCFTEESIALTVNSPSSATILPDILCNDSNLGETTLDLDNLVLGNSGGTWTTDAGTLDADNVLDIDGVNAMAINLSYTTTVNGSCSGSVVNGTITVSCDVDCEAPVLVPFGVSFCNNNDNIIDITSQLQSGDPLLGTWEIFPATNNYPNNTISDPQNMLITDTEGTFQILYTVPADENCPQDLTSNPIQLVIFDTVEASINEDVLPIILCNDAAGGNTAILLDSLVTSDSNGTWSISANAQAYYDATTHILDVNGIDPSITQVSVQYQILNPECGSFLFQTSFNIIDCNICEATIELLPIPNSFCSGDATINLFDYVVNPQGGIWLTNAGAGTLQQGVFNPQNVATSGNYTFTYTFSQQGCPTLTQEVNFSLDVVPTAAFNTTTYTLCNHSDAGTTTLVLSDLLTASSATNGTWSADGGTITNGILDVENMSAGIVNLTYTVASTNPNCGDAQASLAINVEDCVCTENANFAAPPAICAYETFNLATLAVTDNGGYWLINNNNISIIGSLLNPNDNSGSFELTYVVEGEGNCPDASETQIININAAPVVDIYASATHIFAGESVELNASGATDYTWYDAVGTVLGTGSSLTVSPQTNTIYYVEGSDGNLCIDDALISITVGSNNFFEFPSAFSPNNDGINDLFRPMYRNVDTNVFSLQIFNRWGELIFETNDIDQGWNGLYKGREQEVEVYMYVATYKFNDSDNTRVYKGNVTLVR